MTNPSEQGLKLRNGDVPHWKAFVKMTNPSEQGLKQLAGYGQKLSYVI